MPPINGGSCRRCLLSLFYLLAFLLLLSLFLSTFNVCNLLSMCFCSCLLYEYVVICLLCIEIQSVLAADIIHRTRAQLSVWLFGKQVVVLIAPDLVIGQLTHVDIIFAFNGFAFGFTSYAERQVYEKICSR